MTNQEKWHLTPKIKVRDAASDICTKFHFLCDDRWEMWEFELESARPIIMHKDISRGFFINIVTGKAIPDLDSAMTVDRLLLFVKLQKFLNKEIFK
jgi:hypothetical protein